MASYNSLWGIPCVADSMLLTEVLRKRWGFKGYVVSDCDAVADIYQTHHYVARSLGPATRCFRRTR
jgi:beta-glucosidase